MRKHTIIIAEAGVNHNGSLEFAKQLVREAANAGVDYIKFQTFHAEKCVSKYAEKAEYQKNNTGKPTESQLEMVKKLELSEDDHLQLIELCNQLGVKFFSTAFDLESVDFLHSLNIGLWKIPSGEITNFPLLRKIASYNEPVIMSTGMCEVNEINDAIDLLVRSGLDREKIILLHCNTEYPTPFEDVNLKAMDALKAEFNLEVGYSDHTKGIEVSIAAVALGASVIEKHFTLNCNMEGPDHKASLEPDGLRSMVRAIRNIECAISGDGKKHVSNSERKNISIARKSIVASRNIEKGELLTEENLTVKRPGDGISPMMWEQVIGTYATKDFTVDEKIKL